MQDSKHAGTDQVHRERIEYFAVEVTSEAGSQYGISAYGEEAKELCRVATARNTEMPMIVAT